MARGMTLSQGALSRAAESARATVGRHLLSAAEVGWADYSADLGVDEYENDTLRRPCPPELAHNDSLLDYDEGQVYCNSTFDKVSCWPTTLAGHMAILPCPAKFQDVEMDQSANATKMCYTNGTWEQQTDYTSCLSPIHIEDFHNYLVRVLYYIGFTASIVTGIVALFIFLYFKSLWCLRNKIHCHLIVTFLLRNLVWITMNSVLPMLIVNDTERQANKLVDEWACKMIVMLFNYLQGTNFFWMLVEGLYLHLMIIWAFSIDKVKFWCYALIGWFAPAVVIIIWGVIKAKFDDDSCWMPARDNSMYDYIYIAPILAVLFINLLFLGSILAVLVTKLRASNTVHTQYRKALKATLILFPLLGTTYILLVAPPSNTHMGKRIFVYVNTVLQSTQGLMVTTFYCFLNGEVRATIRSRWHRWREGRSVATRYTRASSANPVEHVMLKVSFADGNGSLSRNSLPRNGVRNNNDVTRSKRKEKRGMLDDESDAV